MVRSPPRAGLLDGLGMPHRAPRRRRRVLCRGHRGHRRRHPDGAPGGGSLRGRRGRHLVRSDDTAKAKAAGGTVLS